MLIQLKIQNEFLNQIKFYFYLILFYDSMINKFKT